VLSREGRSAASVELLFMVGLLILSLTALAVILGVLTIARLIQQVALRAEALDHRITVLAEQLVSRPPATPTGGDTQSDTGNVIERLINIEELLILPEPERERRFQLWRQREIEKRLAEADRCVKIKDFHGARLELDRLAEQTGEIDRIAKARQSVENAAEAAQTNDLTAAQGRIRDLMGVGRYADAERVASDLAQQYPNAAEPIGLLGHVRRERQLYEKQHRQRMHDEIQQCVHQRRWQEAADATRRFIQAFPNGPETEALRSELETLLANADIQSRKQMEDDFKSHLKDKRYWEALELARKIISEHPLSPQSQALRSQLPRLEELANAQGPGS
jgi:tetratricopeptide (TPR) repeat protein